MLGRKRMSRKLFSGWMLPLVGLAAAALVGPGASQAADCWGGTARRFSVGQKSALFLGTVTRPGASHASLIESPGDFGLRIVDVNDAGRVLLDVQVPAERFETTAGRTRYDGAGSFDGTIVLRDRPQQADTVLIRVRVKGALDLGSGRPSGVRAEFRSGTTCAHSCVSACRPGGRLRCAKSAVHVPFADAGYGALRDDDSRDARLRSPLCGLEIATGGPRCDFLIDEACLLPYPSSTFLDPDPTTPTGLRVHYDLGTLPSNVAGKPIDPTDWNTLDGFSPGPTILALFPDTGLPVDLDRSNVAFHTNFARSLEADHPSVLMRASDGERVLHFAELDVQTDDVEKKVLILRPGRRLEDATRYLVAVRDLVDGAGTPIRARLAFRALRDNLSRDEVALACGESCADAIEARRGTFEDVFSRLTANGVAREDLLLAWDFTTASTQALTGWMVSIRDQAFALPTPDFSVTSVDDGGGAGRNANIYARIEGTFQAPLFMTADAPASRLNLVGGVPAQNGFATVPFVADIPYVAVASQNPAASPARGSLWGHGLLGTRFQLGTLSELAQTYNFVIAAVDMQGMSDPDLFPSIVPMTGDLSLFHRIPERLHQGFLNHLLLGRLMADPVHGFDSHPAFQLGPAGAGVIDTEQVFYSGGSQGGIFGAAIMGVTTNFERGFLAVPGSNYSTLLQRSIDFEPFFLLFRASYPDPLAQPPLYALIQQLWDRAEPQGYLPHIVAGTLADPPTPHKVLMHMATYDSEVSNLSTEIMLRSMGIPQLAPVHRSFVDVPEQAAPFDGSALVEIDPQLGFSRCHTPGTDDRGAACVTDADCPGTGDPASRSECASGIPPLGNDAPVFNNGAHGSTGTPAAGAQIDAFLRNGGSIAQTCSGPCDPE